MYCSRCGTELPDGAVRCGRCDRAPLPPPPPGSQPVRFHYDGARSRWPTVLKLLGVAAGLAVIAAVASPWLLPVHGELNSANALPSTTAVAVATTAAPIVAETSATVPVDLADPGPSIAGITVAATCTARGSTDASGRPVDFKPENTLDGDPGTAWRCPGDGQGVTLTYTLPAPSDVVAVGAIPGYDTIDAKTGDDRFTQNRRLTSAEWTCLGPDEAVIASVPQTFADERSFQAVLASGFTGCSAVRLTITGTTPPGSRDFVAISEVRVVGPAH